VSQHWPLFLHEEVLPPGGERENVPEGWQFCLLREGIAYWLGTADTRELAVGELLVVGPGARGIFRASQIAEARLRHFFFNPESVVGVFSLVERVELSRLSECGRGGMEILPASHTAAQLVAQTPVREHFGEHLAGRAELLHAALLALSHRLKDSKMVRSTVASAERRLHELLRHVPDGELLSHTPEEIASMCGCSVRHLNRLFRSETASNLRTAQEKARLHRARELIEQTGARVADIAREVGYGHVGQFNAAFKHLFGLTPSQCRNACFQIVTSSPSFRHDPAAK